ncbi:hypothetical protein CROQUDRAFT_686050 [Cronartium quercuum f. sp. fusiforme G11]|uniref:Uncharacterized protein n=1 Tax=Cronartium quercuum f. sp. fusiforme G11 TaxID=708437 RepID=A0A9P6NCK8_9BASI|nr:hypothetical protein CROQUDRAFT_686050 [Cronartium quercuum f. sp. fusiforme G11]
MNINKAYIENFNLLEGMYNHYVHYVMVEKYKKEAKEQGKNVKDEERKVIQWAQQFVKCSNQICHQSRLQAAVFRSHFSN